MNTKNNFVIINTARDNMPRIPDSVDGIPIYSIRPEVMDMADAMEIKLAKNDHKTGWHDQPIEAHIKLLRIEMMELDVALDHLGDEMAAKECVDVANFALIIRDKLLARMKDKTRITEQFDARFEDGKDWAR